MKRAILLTLNKSVLRNYSLSMKMKMKKEKNLSART